MSSPAHSENKSIARSGFKVMLGGAFTLVAGLLSQGILAALFGPSAEMDAYLTALVVPTYLGYVLISGLSFVILPAFIEEESKGARQDAWALVGTFFWIIAVSMTLVALAGSLLSTQVINWTAPGFQPDKARLASQMLVVLFFTTPLIGLSTFAQGIENARGRFFWPSTAAAVGTAGNIIVLLLFHRSWGAMSLAWGSLVSNLLTALVPLVPVLRHGWKRTLPLNYHRVTQALRLIVPFILLGLLTRSIVVFERYFASVLPDGDISYLGYAHKLASIFILVLANGIASPIFPALARAYQNEGPAGLARQSMYGLRLTLVVALPVVAVLAVIAVPLITVLFERGAFTHADTLNISRIVLAVMTADILLRMVGNVLGRSFYVTKDTITFSAVSAATLLLYLPLASLLTQRWGYQGLSLAEPVQATVAILVTFAILARRLSQIHAASLMKDAVFYLALSALAALTSRLALNVTTSLPELVQLVVATGAAAAVYLFILYWRDREMAGTVMELVGLTRLTHLVSRGLRRARPQELKAKQPKA